MAAMKTLATVDNAGIISVEYFSDTIIQEFIASRHASENTNRTYRHAVRSLLKFFTSRKITTPQTSDLDSYVNSLRAAKKSASTLRLYTTAAKLFFAFLEQRGVYSNIAAQMVPLKIRKTSTHKRKALSDDQAKKLLGAVKGDSVIALRDRALIAISLQTGCRTCELSRANVEDLSEDLGGYALLKVQGKGRVEKDSAVKIALPVVEMIQSYLDKRGNVSDDEPLFTSESHNVNWKANRYGRRLSEQSIGKILKKYMVAVGIVDKQLVPHSFRHFAATTAIKAGIDIREVSAFLRHSSILVTTCYLHDLSIETRKAELTIANVLFSAA